jgi:hypothetical protein
MAEVAYGRYEDAYRAIHSALSGIMAPPPGKSVSKLAFTWNLDGSVHTIKAYQGETLLFTLTLTWDGSGNLQDITRT